MDSRCATEIIELHRFFEDWFTKQIPGSEETLSRLSDALAPPFRIITPQGTELDREQLINAMPDMYGQYLNEEMPSVIRISDIECREQDHSLCLMTYREWQGDQNGKQGKERLSSALFREDPSAPHGVAWVHLHEVWTG